VTGRPPARASPAARAGARAGGSLRAGAAGGRAGRRRPRRPIAAPVVAPARVRVPRPRRRRAVDGMRPPSGVPPQAASGGRIRIVASIAPLADLARAGGRRAGRGPDARSLPGAKRGTPGSRRPRAMARMGPVRLFLEVGRRIRALGGGSWRRPRRAPRGRLRGRVRGRGAARRRRPTARTGAPPGRPPAGTGRDAGGERPTTRESRASPPHYGWIRFSLSLACRGSPSARRDRPAGAEGYRGARPRQRAPRSRASSREIRAAPRASPSREHGHVPRRWDYFGETLRPRVVASIESFPGREPGPRTHRRASCAARRRGKVRAVFAEPQSSAKARRRSPRSAASRCALTDPLGGEGSRAAGIISR
jgi:hypothetical protein